MRLLGLLVAATYWCQLCFAVAPTYEDVYVPDNCVNFVEPGDHVLVEYEILFHNGSIAQETKRPDQLIHIVVKDTVEMNSLLKGFKGMCKGGSRKFEWSTAFDANLQPIVAARSHLANLHEPLSAIVTMDQITKPVDYAIFEAFRAENTTQILSLIDEHIGVNAVDQWGQTPLMLATINNNFPVIAALLNARRPSVEVNMAKSSGATALFSAVEHAPAMIVQALLRRGADPNLAMRTEDALGNTPLHYACLLEKTKHAELLLDYGANPFAVNKFQNTPLQLLPSDAVVSSKLYFKRIFENARTKWNSLTMDGHVANAVPFRHDL